MTLKASQVSDPALNPFLATSFDPAAYLNSTLPPLQSSKSNRDAVSLAALSSQTQALLATLNAQSTRLATNLTHMTDDIVRSGSRLAYQVDLLRGDALSLNESLTERLAKDVDVFTIHEPVSNEPPSAIERLRILLSVRARLDSVIKLFGAALAWPPPPVSSGPASFISVASSPTRDADAKAVAWLDAQKAEFNAIIAEGNESLADSKLVAFKELARIWANSAEEKARDSVVSSLEQFVNKKLNRIDEIDEQEDEQQRAFLAGIYT
jgi:hypothetical protein